MDHGSFDALTRSVASGGETRRAVLRLLAGGALGGFPAWLGLAEIAAAKPRKKRQRGAAQKQDGGLQTEGKRKGKKGSKKKPKPKSPPKPSCGADEWPCVDGSCVAQGACCPGEKRCGGGCIAEKSCCPYTEWECADGSCVPHEQCCPGEKPCAGGACVSDDQCCPGEKRCIEGGQCYAADFCCPNDPEPTCGQCEVAVCEGGELTCGPTGRAPCQEGCCPEGYWCHSLGSCCTNGPPFHCTCPSGYGPCAGRCCKRCCGSFCCPDA